MKLVKKEEHGKALTSYEKNRPDVWEMCEEIADFIARKRNAVMGPVNEN